MIEFKHVVRIYGQGRREVRALDDVSLRIEPGGFVAVTGPSGSGKSTLLHLAGGLDLATEGVVSIDGVDPASVDDGELSRLRRRRIGFIFQFFNLIPTMTVVENTALPLLLDGRRLAGVRPAAEDLLGRAGLTHRLDHLPDELSGGELQRVAVARALIADPPLLLADEPTGNLDRKNGEAILDLLREMGRGRTVVMVTHDEAAASVADERIRLLDGRVV